jgi:hypothetical protein
VGSLQPGDANFYFNRGNTLLAMKEARCRAAWTQITPPYSEYRVWGSDYPCEYSEYLVPQESLALRDLELAVSKRDDIPPFFHSIGVTYQSLGR